MNNLQQQYLAALSTGVQSFWQTEVFTDIDIFIEDTKFSCHKLIMAAISNYFNSMFTSGMRESKEGLVRLRNVDATTFESVLHFIYTGNILLTADNVDSILQATIMLQVQCLQDHCEQFLANSLSANNCIGIWKLASAHGCSELAQTSWNFLLENFAKVVNCEEFKCLDQDDLISIIKDNNLNTPSEEAVCEAVISWASDHSLKENSLSDLFANLRFPHMDLQYIHSLEENHLVRSDTESMQILLKATEGSPCDSQSYRQDEVMCAIGSRGRNPDPQRIELKCFSFQQQSLFTLSHIPYEPGPCFAVCQYNNDLFLTGGYMDRNLQLQFVSSENKWHTLPRMCVGRWNHAVVACDNTLYNFGGSSGGGAQKSCEMLDLECGKCELLGELQIPVPSASAAVLGDKIYIFGGPGDSLPVVQCIDTKTRTCKYVVDLPVRNTGGTQSRTVVHNNCIYILYGNGNIIEFMESSAPSLVGKLEKMDHFGAICQKRRILIFGKQNNQSHTLYFDPESREWGQHLTTVNIPLSGFHCFKFVISKKYLNNS